MTHRTMIKQLVVKLGFPLILVASVMGFQSVANAAESAGPQARDILLLTDWFEGRFDNSEEMWFVEDSRSGVTKQDYHVRMHVMHRRLDLPSFGKHIFYVEEYRDNDPTKITRQRFVRFTPEKGSSKIRMEQGFFKNKEKFVGGYFDPEMFSKLTPADVFFMKDLDPDGKCDVFWERKGGQYHGAMLEKECMHVANEGERDRYYVHDMMLSENEYWRVDTSFHVDDNSRRVGVPREDPVQMRRAITFECTGNFRPKGGAFLTNKGVKPIEQFLLHNQGGTATITRESDNKSFDILLREKLYPFYEKQPDFLYLSLRNAGKERSFTYTISDVNSRRFGLFNDAEGVQVFCSRPGYNFDETLLELKNIR